MARFRIILVVGAILLAGIARTVPAQQLEAIDDAARARAAMSAARAEALAAGARADRLESEAARVTQEADRTARQAAAIAARIQEGEAQIAGLQARARLIAVDRARLRGELAARQQPLVRLTAALQRLSRRPPILALLRPGSIEDTVHMRAVLATLLPQVEARTAALRSQLARGRVLQARALAAAKALRTGEGELLAQRRNLAALESRQRLSSRMVTNTADREAERALALAERASDLGGLVRDLGQAGQLREALASLPGPIMRPAGPNEVPVPDVLASSGPVAVLAGYMLPLNGRLLSGFGSILAGGARSRGLAIAARPGAQIVAPAGGRIAFAGPFRGFGRIVIIEHGGGFTSLVTGMAELDARVSDTVVAGSPLGVTGAGAPVVTVELRRNGEPVNPLQFIAVS